MRHDLKPCPFCGYEAKIEGNSSDGFWVECQKCGSETTVYLDRVNAADFWNRRITQPEGGTPVAWAVMNSQGVLHSLTLVFETAEHNAKVCKQTVVPLYRSIPQVEQG